MTAPVTPDPLADYTPNWQQQDSVKADPLADYNPNWQQQETRPDFGVLDAVAHGMPFADKLNAALEAAGSYLPNLVPNMGNQAQAPQPTGSFGDRYKAALAKQLAAAAAYEKAHPVANALGEMTGATMALGPLAKFLPGGTTLGSRIGGGLAGGALGGAIYGASGAEPGKEGTGALIGGAVGAPVGLATGLAAHGLDKLFQAIKGGPVNPEQKVAELFNKHPAFQGKDGTELAAKVAQAAARDQPLTLAQLGDRAMMEGEGGQPGLLHYVAEDPKGLAAMQQFSKAQQQAADKLYEVARSKTVTITDPMKQLLDDPLFERAYMEGQDIARVKGDKLPNLVLPSEDAMTTSAKAIGRAFGGAGSILDIARTMTPSQLAKPGNEKFAEALSNASLPEKLPVRALDYMKKGLDVMIDRGQNSQYPINQDMAAGLRARLNQVLGMVGEQVPEYTKARQTAQTYMQLQDAIQHGRFVQGKMPELGIGAPEPSHMPYPSKHGIGYRVGKALLGNITPRLKGTAAEMLLSGVNTAPTGGPNLQQAIQMMQNPAPPNNWQSLLAALAGSQVGGATAPSPQQ